MEPKVIYLDSVLKSQDCLFPFDPRCYWSLNFPWIFSGLCPQRFYFIFYNTQTIDHNAYVLNLHFTSQVYIIQQRIHIKHILPDFYCLPYAGKFN